jgi:hypothetical protein
MKYLGINLQNVKNLYEENYKTLAKKLKTYVEIINVLCSLIGRYSIVKMSVLDLEIQCN